MTITMHVVALEGAHGCGKTSLCDMLRDTFVVVEELFVDTPCGSLHPQSTTIETAWVVAWFRRILEEFKRDPDQTIVADRSPYSAVFYAAHGDLLKPLIDAQVAELAKIGVRIVTIHVDCETELLWLRVCARLEHEPDRLQFGEGSRSRLVTVQDFYREFDWTHTVDGADLEHAADQISDYVKQISTKR